MGRIFAEDLTVSESGDFDFNDVVLDIYKDGDGAYAMLMAEGATLPIYVGEMYKNEFHVLFGVETHVMVNTAPGQHSAVAPVKIELPATVKTPADVRIWVKKTLSGQEYLLELQVKQGKAPSKILVKEEVDWADERQSIEEKHPKFKQYVFDPSVVWWEK